jgi:adenosylcobyric acid synthase
MVGTLQLLKAKHRALVKGFLVNKFRGDQSLLEPAIKETRRLTGKRILGVIPKIDLDLPEEDSLVGGATRDDLPQDAWDWQIDILAKAIKESMDVKRLDGIVGV